MGIQIEHISAKMKRKVSFTILQEKTLNNDLITDLFFAKDF